MFRDSFTVQRCQQLGLVGEQIAETELPNWGFSNVRNLNLAKRNFAYGDFYAERDGHRYVISVKARNKFELGGKLNARYKLGARCYKHASEAERLLDAEAAWLTIQLDETTYSAYFGLLSSLKGNTGIAMTEDAVGGYECCAKNASHAIDFSALSNQPRTPAA